MKKNYSALVKKLNPNIEEEVLLNVAGFDILCFAGVCPYAIEIGKSYDVTFELNIFNDYKVAESKLELYRLDRINESFSYNIWGQLCDENIILGELTFEDDYLMGHFPNLNGKFIKMIVDRINVEFL